MPRSDGPFEVLEKVKNSAYKIDLPGEYEVSATFNIVDLSPYYDDSEKFPSLSANSFEEEGNDGSVIQNTPNDDPIDEDNSLLDSLGKMK